MHDELIFEVHPDDSERAQAVVRHVMETACLPEVVPMSLYRVTSLTRNRTTLGPYSRPMRRWS